MKTKSLTLLLFLSFHVCSEISSFDNVLRGSWYNPNTAGQGIILDYNDETEFVFGGWFTFTPNHSEHLWFSVSGTADNARGQHTLLIKKTSGGVFNQSSTSQNETVGEASINFSDCNHAEMSFSVTINDEVIEDVIPLRRSGFIDESLCDPLYKAGPVPETIDKSEKVLIKDVKYLDFDSEDYIRASLLIENGIITAIYTSDLPELNDEIVIVDARSRYLIPGLADMHTHLATNVREQLGLGAPLQLTEESAVNQLILYLASGVTTILNNGDFGETLPLWALKVDNGDYIGPKIYSAKYARGGSQTCDGGPPNVAVTTAQQAQNFVQTAKNEGYHFMKTYNCTPPSALQSILDVSQSMNMPVIGHLPQTMDSRTVLQSGMKMVAHAEAYVWTFFNFSHNPQRIPQAVSLTQDNDVTVTATLSILQLIAQVWGNNEQGIEDFWNRAETIYMHPTTRNLNNRSITSARFNPPGAIPGQYDPRRDFVFSFTKQLYDGGVRILMGTDSPTVMGVPGFSAFDEMLALQETGLTPFQVLQVSTQNGGDFISENVNEEHRFGIIVEGARADLILLSADPLNNLDFRDSILGVMAQGRFYSQSFFDSKLEQIAESYQ